MEVTEDQVTELVVAGSGGGSVNIFFNTNNRTGTVTATGGARGTGTRGSESAHGGAGGNGTVSIGNVSTGIYK